jgi:hypothetical protein
MGQIESLKQLRRIMLSDLMFKTLEIVLFSAAALCIASAVALAVAG